MIIILTAKQYKKQKAIEKIREIKKVLLIFGAFNRKYPDGSRCIQHSRT
jgi:hypothetical protein